MGVAYVLLAHTSVAVTVFSREPGGPWIATDHTAGSLTLAGLDIAVPLDDICRGLRFPAPVTC